MSRFNPNHHVAPIYDAAAAWKENCFLADGSALSDGGNLWTNTLLGELDQRFVKNLDAGDPNAWLTQTLERIAGGWPNSQIADLMPWNFRQ